VSSVEALTTVLYILGRLLIAGCRAAWRTWRELE
jgi:hypothetical protein